MTDETSDALWRDPKGRPFFSHRPRLFGGEIALTLEPDALTWSDGRTTGRLPLHQISAVRLLFRPANLYTQRYRLELRQRLGRKLWFSNISYRGMASVEAHDAAFSAFVRELLKAIARAAPKARFIAGEPAWRYAAATISTVVMTLTVAWLAYEAARARNWPMLGALGVVGGYIWVQMWPWLTKNQQRDMDPNDPPAKLLPTNAVKAPSA